MCEQVLGLPVTSRSGAASAYESRSESTSAPEWVETRRYAQPSWR